MEIPRQALPKPEEEEAKFLGRFKHLNQKEIREVLKIIIDKARESEEYGLYLGNELLEKEERFFLLALDHYGGIANLAANHDFDQVSLAIAGAANNLFENEAREFHKKFSKEGGGANTRYSVHLELTRGAILNAAYNGGSDLRQPK